MKSKKTLMARALAAFGYAPVSPKRGNQYSGSRIAPKVAFPVNFDNAMTVSAVWACIRILAESVACLTLTMYEKRDGVRVPIKDHELSQLLRNKPNRYQTRIEFFESLMLNLVCDGNAYVKKDYATDGRLISLQVFNSGDVRISLDETGELIYTVTDSNYKTTLYTRKEIWHVKTFGAGLVGMSTLSYAAKSIGISLSSDNKVTDLLANGAKPTGVLLAEGYPTEEQRGKLKVGMNDLLNGADSTIAILPGNMKYQAISLSPTDIQLLETRRFSLEEICRFFNVPSILVNDTSSTTSWGSGITELVSGFYKFGLRPYLERIEESMRINLVDPWDWDNYEFEFNINDLLRASLEIRIAAYAKRLTTGQCTVNEARKEEGLDPVAGGDVTMVPANMTTLQKLGENPQPTTIVNNTDGGQAA
jgi:HK97 family phage portal protein